MSADTYFCIDFAPARVKLRQIARCTGQLLEERRFKLRVAQLLGELNHPAGIHEHLDRFRPRDLVEEPSATGVHQERVPLHLE